jgi:hypothetical protein
LLGPEETWLLRLARVEPQPPPEAWICVRRTRSDEPPKCTPAVDAAEAPGADPTRAMENRLRVTTSDLLKGEGVDIEMVEGTRVITSRRGAAHEIAIKRSALCLGLDFQLPDARVTFYLDDP